MADETTGPWLPLTPGEVARIPERTGVFELAGGDERVLFVGVAGRDASGGLRAELAKHAAVPTGGATLFRYETTNRYRARWLELLREHKRTRGGVPPGNRLQHLPPDLRQRA